MSRLIDADELLAQIRQIDFLKIPNSTKLSACEIMEIVNNQPTVYNVDKVVAEFDSAKNYYYNDEFDEEGDLIMVKSIRQDVAIDIVRKGGVE